MRIPFETLKAEFKRVLISLQFTEARAEICANTFAESSRDGIHTHGLNRFPSFVEYIKEGLVKPDAEPALVNSLGAIEQWDGNLGPGILNARFCMNRAMQLAEKNGIGCVALKNTNHWMRGGTYGWQAAEAGYISISFTNTIANLPPWGGLDPRLGNNPLVIGVPRSGGHVVLDMAISQYAYGKLQRHKAQNMPLPLPGGYDTAGNLSTDASAIIESQRMLPIGFWKGSGLSLVLDLMVTALSGGHSTAKITDSGKESGSCQVFICMKPHDAQHAARLIEEIITYTKTSTPEDGHTPVAYPGENTLKNRKQSMREGVWVDEAIWKQVQAY